VGEPGPCLNVADSVAKMEWIADRRAVPPARKALAHLMLGGVFDRFPALKVLVVELRGD
jgi:hypothetical protein